MTIIDFRLRPPTRGYLKMILYANAERRDRLTRQHGFEPARSAREQSMELLLAEMDAAGVTMGVVVGRLSTTFGSVTNEDVAGIVSDYPGRFIGVASIDPLNRRAAVAEIDRAITAGLKAVNIEPASYATPMKADDRRLYPIYAHCEDLQVPVIIMAGGSAGPDLSYTEPAHLDRVLADFPDLKIVVSHGGWPWVHQVLHIAYRRPNLYVSPDQYLAGMPGTSDYINAANTFLQDRFLYGSSYPFTPVKDYADWFRALPIDPGVMDKLLYRNAAKLLGLNL